MLKGKKSALSLLTVLFAFLAPLFLSSGALSQELTLNPQGEIKYGALELHPGLRVEGTADSNIFLDRTRKRSDYILKVSPSGGIALPFGRSRFAAEFVYDIYEFDRSSREDHQDKTVDSALDLVFNRFDSRSHFRWFDTEDPSTSEQQSVTGPRTPRTQLTVEEDLNINLTPKFVYRFFEGSWNKHRFDRSTNDRLNRNEYRFGQEFGYQALPKSYLTLNYGYSVINYTDRTRTDIDSDSDSYFLGAGMRFEPRAKLTGRFRAGFEKKLFEAFDNDEIFFVETNLSYRPLARTTLVLLINRNFGETASSGRYTSERTDGTIGIVQGIWEKIELSALYRRLYERFPKSLPSQPRLREDNLWNVTLEGSYRFRRWLLMGLRYEHETKNSSENENDYDVNRGTVFLQAKF